MGAKVGIASTAVVLGVALILWVAILLVKRGRRKGDFQNIQSQTHPMAKSMKDLPVHPMGEKLYFSRLEEQMSMKPKPISKWASSHPSPERQHIYEAGPGIPHRRHELESP